MAAMSPTTRKGSEQRVLAERTCTVYRISANIRTSSTRSRRLIIRAGSVPE